MPVPARYDENNPALVSAIDDAPLWSAPFGLALLKEVDLRANLVALDVGSGLGFPSIELAQRLGSTGRVFGIDPWTAANERARRKIDAACRLLGQVGGCRGGVVRQPGREPACRAGIVDPRCRTRCRPHDDDERQRQRRHDRAQYRDDDEHLDQGETSVGSAASPAIRHQLPFTIWRVFPTPLGVVTWMVTRCVYCGALA